VSDGTDIARWWLDRSLDERGYAYARIQSCDGFTWEMDHDEGTYTYVWMEAYIDGDMDQHFLLDVRTRIKGMKWETRDYLYVGIVHDKVECEWMNKPIAFEADVDEHRARFSNGMRWLTERVELSWERP
jgi:hypothetical protein